MFEFFIVRKLEVYRVFFDISSSLVRYLGCLKDSWSCGVRGVRLYRVVWFLNGKFVDSRIWNRNIFFFSICCFFGLYFFMVISWCYVGSSGVRVCRRFFLIFGNSRVYLGSVFIGMGVIFLVLFVCIFRWRLNLGFFFFFKEGGFEVCINVFYYSKISF